MTTVSITPTTLTAAKVHAVLPAEDIERAKRFYGETLGLEVEQFSSEEIAIHAGGGTEIFMYQRARTKAEHTAAEFVVDDLRATVSELRSRGVRFEEYDLPGIKTVDGITEDEGGLAAWFTDPEGNIVAVMQTK